MKLKFTVLSVLLFAFATSFAFGAEVGDFSPEGSGNAVEGSSNPSTDFSPEGSGNAVDGNSNPSSDFTPEGSGNAVDGDNGSSDSDDEDDNDDDSGSRSSRSGQRRSSGSSRGEVLGATTGSCPLITSYMRMGQANDVEQVKALQEFLNKELGISLPVTGFFGELTTKAVNDFQLKYKNDVLKPWVDAGLHSSVEVPTGFVYITTSHMINSIVCPDFDEELPALVPASN